MKLKEIIEASKEVMIYLETNPLDDYSEEFLRKRIEFLTKKLEEKMVELEQDTTIFIAPAIRDYVKAKQLNRELSAIKETLK